MLFDRSFNISFEFNLRQDGQIFDEHVLCGSMHCYKGDRASFEKWSIEKRNRWRINWNKNKETESKNKYYLVQHSIEWLMTKLAPFVELQSVLICKCRLNIFIYISVNVVARAIEYNAIINWCKYSCITNIFVWMMLNALDVNKLRDFSFEKSPSTFDFQLIFPVWNVYCFA